MDALEAMRTRRSIRKYTVQPVPQEIIDKLLRAGMSAPSAGNRQPWAFLVIPDLTVLDEIVKVIPSFDLLKEATLGILVCGDLTKVRSGSQIWVQGCAAATQNILLAAHALGLGAVWLGVYPDQAKVDGLKKQFVLPQEIVPMALIAAGYPAEQKPPEDRYDGGKVHTNKW